MFKKFFHFSIVYSLVLSFGIAQQYPMIQITYNPLEQVEPWIAINPSNPSFILVAWSDARWGGSTYEPLVGYSFSTNGGNNWSVDDTMAYPTSEWVADYHIAEHVTIAFNRSGMAFCCYRIGYDNRLGLRSWGIVASKTNNFENKDWVDVIIDKVDFSPATANYEMQRDFPFLAIDNTGIIGKDGNIYIAWVCREQHEALEGLDSIKFCRSTDSGATFSTPMLIDRQIISSDTLIRFPRIAIGPNGEVYLAWLRYKYQSLGNGEIRIKKSINGGQSFSPGFVSIQVGAMIDIPFGHLDISSYPALSVDKNTGYIYLAWANYESGDVNIRFSRSTDAGQIFSTPVIATEHTLNKQFFPALTVDPTGKVILTYSSNHSNSQYVNLFMTESYDNGISFSRPDIDVTTSDNNNDPAVGSFPYFSYHHGTSADVGYNYPVWQYATGSIKADIYNSRVNRTPTSNSGAATAYGSVQKTIYSTITNRWNTIYMSNGALYHMYSTDEGATWNDYTRISGTVGGIVISSNPTLVEDNTGTLHCVFSSSGNGIYYTKKVGDSWITPVQLYSGTKTSYPTLTVDNNGYGHVVFVSDQPGVPLAILYYLLYGKFNTTSPGLFENPITITGPTTTFTGTSLTQLNNGQLHAVWSRSNEIYYSYGSESGWSTPLNISNNTGISECPSIASIDYGTGYTLRVAWQDKTPGNYDIFCRHNSNGSWNPVSNITDNLGQSKFPIVKKSFFFGSDYFVVMWSDNTGNSDPNNYDIWYQLESTTPTKLISTSQPSMYPTFSERRILNTTKYFINWTEGSTTPYKISSTTMDNPYGKKSISSAIDTQQEFELFENYPNPFNPSTLIKYYVPENIHVELKIYDILGREVATLINEMQEAGYKSVELDASALGGLPSGLYLYRLKAGKFISVKKMLLIQ